ncbi:MAG TPA: DUF4145 domain-containing protein [Puia sp.]|nr:DUF4145 domain-containing protein [Puia sp.]
MNREIWKIDFFGEMQPTNWLCSKCFIGSLFPKSKPVLIGDDRFIAHLKCSHIDCRKEYGCLGEVRFFSSSTRTEVSKIYYGAKYKQFYPLHFTPILQLFPVNSSVPQSVVTSLEQSFDAFWKDTWSSANALRRALEKLLDELGVPMAKALHQRIESSQGYGLDHTQLFSAIKLIGNTGSHGNPLIKDDLLDAYTIFEHCLGELYRSGDKNSAFRLAQDIITRQGGRLKT